MSVQGRTIAVFVVIMMAELTACKTGGRIEPMEGPVAIVQYVDYDPCVLVSKADAEAILGEAMDRAKDTTTPVLSHKTCGYLATSQTSVKMVNVFLQPLSMGSQGDMWNGTKEMWRSMGKEVRPVAGLGKEAFLEPNGTLQVLTSNCILVISVHGFKEETQGAEAEKAFAQKALSRM